MGGSIREVGDGEKGVLVEDFAVQEPLEEVPRHWCLEAPRKRLAAWGTDSGSGSGVGTARARGGYGHPDAGLRARVKGVVRGASEYKPRARIASHMFDIKV